MPTITVKVTLNQTHDEISSNTTSVRVIAQWFDNGITTGNNYM